jgi:hypothetical protein
MCCGVTGWQPSAYRTMSRLRAADATWAWCEADRRGPVLGGSATADPPVPGPAGERRTAGFAFEVQPQGVARSPADLRVLIVSGAGLQCRPDV